MRQNILRTEERRGHINDIGAKTDDLKNQSNQFRRGANRVRKHLMWKNVQMWIWIFVGLAILIIAIALGESSISTPI